MNIALTISNLIAICQEHFLVWLLETTETPSLTADFCGLHPDWVSDGYSYSMLEQASVVLHPQTSNQNLAFLKSKIN